MRRSLLQLSRAALCGQQAPVASGVQPCIAQAAPCWQQICSSQRSFSQAAAADDPQQQQQQQQQGDDEDVAPRVKQLAADIMALSVLECSQLSRILRDKLGVPRGAGGMAMMAPMMMGGAGAPAGGAGGAGAAGAAEAPAEAAAAEKTEFDVKLEGFSPEGKIKVIKEIRALTNLGLKEAKELVRVVCGCHSTRALRAV
jgi:large subunit ribosomal protein L7/L12